MRIKYYMHNKEPKKYNKFKLPSQWQPHPMPCNELEDYFEETKRGLAQITIKHSLTNIPKSECNAIRSLQKDTSIVIKKFDKGRGVAILNKEDYQLEALRQLSGPQYKQISNDITANTSMEVKTLICDMHKNKDISKEIFEYLNPDNNKVRTPIFYLLPKVHKTPPEGTKFIGRPIISGCGGPTQQISEFVDYFLLPIVVNQPTYVKDTNHIIHILEDLILTPDILLVTMDVVGMYTNIPQEEAINACTTAYTSANQNLYDIPKPSPDYIKQMLELIIKRNCFSFNKEFYIQTVGVAMGSESSPEIADIAFHILENQILTLSDKLLMWKRYRDDILLFFSGSEKELEDFINQINHLHPTLKFTYESSFNKVSYLDIQIFKGNRFASSRILDTSVYTKSCETFQYLPKSSCHPQACFKGFVKGEILRYLRLCNNADDFKSQVAHFKERLIPRGYTADFFDNISETINHADRASALVPKTKTVKTPLVFKFEYTPNIKTKDLKNALTRAWDKIENHPTLSKIYPKPPLLAYKRAKNLSDSLIRAAFVSETSHPSDETEEILLDSDDDSLNQHPYGSNA